MFPCQMKTPIPGGLCFCMHVIQTGLRTIKHFLKYNIELFCKVPCILHSTGKKIKERK